MFFSYRATLPIYVSLSFVFLCVSKVSAGILIKEARNNLNMLSSGVYYAEGSMYSGSRRDVLSDDNRTCIRVVDGTPSPYSGQENITVSTLSFANNQAYLDATNDAIIISQGSSAYGSSELGTAFQYESSPRRGNWEIRESTITADIERLEQDDQMQACLQAEGEYSYSGKGAHVP